MRAIHLSRKGVEVFNSDKPWVCISITDPINSMVDFIGKKNLIAVLPLKFSDIDRMPKPIEWHGEFLDFDNLKLFNVQQAKKILQFFKDFRDIGFFVCHCEAGISRSAAVAAALLEIDFIMDDKRPQDASWHIFRDAHPNKHVYKLLLETYMEDVDD